MKHLPPLITLTISVLSGCALTNQPLPVLGVVEDGIYSSPRGDFVCPLPGTDQGFSGEVTIVDAGEIFETRQVVIPVGERKPGEGTLRNEIVYPKKVVPNPTITFTDSASEGRWLEILSRPLRPGEEHAEIYASGYGGGNYGLLRESRGERDGLKYGMAVLQMPYFVKGHGYMGVDLWEMYLNGDDPGPDIDIAINLIDHDQHYFFLMRTTSLEFLTSDTNPKDLMAVYDRLRSDTGTISLLEERMFALVRACRFTPPNQR